MCGILALMHPARNLPTSQLRFALDSLRHRGPDDLGVWRDEATGVALGHTRLSVLDLSVAGHQPMVSTSGRFAIVFNGEIYNHLGLRRELDLSSTAAAAAPQGVDSQVQSGPTWCGYSDTETLLCCIERWGLCRTLDKINGMFAFALWDRQEGTLHLARDRMGEKPLYYGYVDGIFAVASELGALARLPGFDQRIDRGALSLMVRYGCVSAPHCIYEGLAKLLPGTALSVSLGDVKRRSCPTPRPYWSAVECALSGAANPLAFRDDIEAIETLEEQLRTAIRGQMLSDVPLGAFLSGGIDSSTVVALMQAESQAAGSGPVMTFSIGFHEAEYNEADTAHMVASHLGTRHTELYVTPAECMEVIPHLSTLYSEPFADSSQIATFLVARLARQQVTVALSGDAGDELFGGYNRHVLAATMWPRASRFPMPARRLAAWGLGRLHPERVNKVFSAISSMLPKRLRIRLPGEKIGKLACVLASQDGPALYRQLVSAWDPTGIVLGATESDTAVHRDWPALPSLAEQMMLLDLMTFLPDDILVKVDRAAMGVSLETRIPYLDRDVVDFALRLPLRYKVRDGRGKWLLRQVLHRHVPRELVERPKMGFSVPIGKWLRGPLRDWAEALLDEEALRRDGLFHPGPIRKAWAVHLSSQRNCEDLLWPVLMFQNWLHSQQATTRHRDHAPA